MSSSSLLHTIWGPIECSSSAPSDSQDGSTEARENVRHRLPDQHQVRFKDLSSPSDSEHLSKELRAHATTSSNHPGVEQSTDSGSATSADGPKGVHRQTAKTYQDLPRVHFQDLPSSSASECPGMQAARMHCRPVSSIVAGVGSLELGNDAQPADNGSASSNGVAPSAQPLSREAALLDSLGMWSHGSVMHQTGECRPCHYAHTSAGCIKGRSCAFCHLPHTGSGQHRPCKTRRKQCHSLAMLLERQQPEELRRLVAREAAGEAVPAEWPAPEGLALTVQQVASKSPYLRTFMRKHWSTEAPSAALAPSSTGAASSRQTHSNQHGKGERTLMWL